MRRSIGAYIAGSLVATAEAVVLQLPSDVGNGEGGDHPCVAVMRETQALGRNAGLTPSECGRLGPWVQGFRDDVEA